MLIHPADAALRRLLQRPDLAVVAAGCGIVLDPTLDGDFIAGAAGQAGWLRLNPTSLTQPDAAVQLRHGIELASLCQAGVPPALAGLAAARVAARFAAFERLAHTSAPPPDWIGAMAAPIPPEPPRLVALWQMLAPHQPSADAAAATALAIADQLATLWSLLGPVETLLQEGGDDRLELDPDTGLNRYGCSHRPRPWAVTFASSTASSTSERGFAAAEAARRRLLHQAITDGPAIALARMTGAVCADLADFYSLPPGGAVLLAPSGTDCELAALALAQLADQRPVTNLLVAPEETGSGVVLAAQGRHFAADTACGGAVRKGDPVVGFRTDTILVPIALRGADGMPLPAPIIAAAIEQAADHALAADRRVLAHLLDVSKTGLLAPDPAVLLRLQARDPGRIDVVVDACQARLEPARVADYLRAGWLVLVTGSKFFTGPPFTGALLLPPAMAGRLAGSLPSGLDDYLGQVRPGNPAPASPGLVLRWQATLAEMHAFVAVPPARRAAILSRFARDIGAAIAANRNLLPVAVPALDRPPLGSDWDCLPTIHGFAIRAPGQSAPLSPEHARQIYHWLNSDLRAALPDCDPGLAGLRCHIGQPAPVATPDGGSMGVLRLCAGARLVSGEPAHAGLPDDARLTREISDAKAVLAKIDLILRHYPALLAADPRPTFC